MKKALTKEEYVHRSLAKLKHKSYEHYVINRVFHRLNDPEIEFVCQQLVRTEKDKWFLTDMYFPQFGLYLEVDETHHEKPDAKENDALRRKEIFSVTGSDEWRIKTYKLGKNEDCEDDEEQKIPLPLDPINDKADGFVELLRRRKEELGADFVPWDYENRYNPETHIERGRIEIGNDAVFRSHVDVIRCFGKTLEQHARGSWKLPNDSDAIVWFPKLYPNSGWLNDLSEDGKEISEKQVGSLSKVRNQAEAERKTFEWKRRIVFAHRTDAFGNTLYRFLGVFEPESVIRRRSTYRRIAKAVKLPDGSSP